MLFKFEKLMVWQKILDLSLIVNEAAKHFPGDERYVLRSQIQRTADSGALYIAEGSTKQSHA